jgi:RNA polymerase sigma factor (sigma-70 family)
LPAFEDRLTGHYRERFAALVRRWRRWHDSVDETNDTLQTAYLRIFATYQKGGENQPQSDAELDRMVHRVIRNIIIDNFRKQENVANLEALTPKEDESDENLDWWERSVATPPVDAIAVTRLHLRVLDQLTPKNRRIIILTYQGYTPPEIGGELGSNGYVLVRYAKERYAAALVKFAEQGDDLAAGLARTLFRLDELADRIPWRRDWEKLRQGRIADLPFAVQMALRTAGTYRAVADIAAGTRLPGATAALGVAAWRRRADEPAADAVFQALLGAAVATRVPAAWAALRGDRA